MTKLCECECGQPAPISKYTDIRQGCIKGQPLRFINGHNTNGQQALRHGASRAGSITPEYTAYISAKYRCENPTNQAWSYYGGRGIQFNFLCFEQFFAELGPKPSHEHSLDRIKNDGHYEPGNVRWATRSEQEVNKRHVKTPEFRQKIKASWQRRKLLKGVSA